MCVMFSHQEEREYCSERQRNIWDFEPKERLHQKFKVQSANFLSVPLVKETARKTELRKWPEASLPGSAAVSRLRFYYIWFSQHRCSSEQQRHSFSVVVHQRHFIHVHRSRRRWPQTQTAVWTPLRQDPWKAVDDKLEIASLSSVKELSLPWA